MAEVTATAPRRKAAAKPAGPKPGGPKPGGPKPGWPKPGWHADLAAFWAGFSQPSGTAFVAFCASLLATLALMLWLFSESTLAGWYGRYLPRSGLDAEGFATRLALQSAREDIKFPRLIFLGTSTVAQAVGSGHELEDVLKEMTGQDWRVLVLTTPLQSPADQFALIDRALENQRADSPRVVVAVGFGLQRLRWTPELTVSFARNRRIGLRSDWEDAEVRALGGTPEARSGFYPLDNLRFVLVNGSEALLRLVLHRPATRIVDQYALGVKPRPSDEVRSSIGSGIRDNFAALDRYLAQIDRLAVNIASRPNVDLVLIEDPLSPALVVDQKLEAVHDQFSRRLAQFAASRNIGYWPVNTEAQLSAADFFDDLHVLVGAEQDKLRLVLALHMIGFLARGNVHIGN